MAKSLTMNPMQAYTYLWSWEESHAGIHYTYQLGMQHWLKTNRTSNYKPSKMFETIKKDSRVKNSPFCGGSISINKQLIKNVELNYLLANTRIWKCISRCKNKIWVLIEHILSIIFPLFMKIRPKSNYRSAINNTWGLSFCVKVSTKNVA